MAMPNFYANSANWLNGLFATNPISPPIQQHLVNVYSTLANVLALAVAGSYVHLNRHTSMLMGLEGGMLSALASFACLMAFQFADPAQMDWRRGLLYGFGFLQGLSLGPMLEFYLWIRPDVVFNALTVVGLMFACFSLAAFYSSKRQVIYTAGILASASAVMMWMSFASLFVYSRSLWSVEMYLGLFTFSLYLIYDTQMMIAKAEAGSRDYLRHALELFMDLVNLFMRVLQFLNDRKEREERKERRKQR